MGWRVQIVGGHRDGELVDDVGPFMFEPVVVTAGYVPADQADPVGPVWRERVYDRRRGPDGERYYVLRDEGP